ncbi:MAG: RNA polymerase factor sigma-54 [Hydrogenophaga sp.]|uniref:RNA polymerase factor sigma-54 n=1 Tax=Hydrogenophaga sp. TaxID=1904254 RepID=UPI0016B7252D|nr:RNA polymerase factor sigma-54 [Hydrogenophaga sp.]NIM40057.1 RNA polymerase factor sigma-54 [Hydrogenophaga sp.]NIN25253.1 RNA polymerase factor sigma-54 [Hydrogenophaga sp.]NIN29820.1 RNA polymerase factor sigma-54 [Hydrogenophaga sp.]NIN54292.1 RNA polymerase factor sigma-54 [Hydrogenophaga sp.]NIO50705.1 RNA polymerase factor sigma-54 [Hydrogenophaga sp.]
MKQSLSLRVSQHLALTPQLQQSIRLLQLSTLEMAQEVEQMLDENPFLERADDGLEREEFGLAATDAPVNAGEQIADAAAPTTSTATDVSDGGDGEGVEATLDGASPMEESWDGDGTVEVAPDDSEWGGDAPPRSQGSGDDDDTASAADLARALVSLQDHLHEQARCLRLSDEDAAALLFLIESLDDDGYLSDPLPELALALLRLRGDDGSDADSPEAIERREACEQLLRTNLQLLQHMDPPGVGARDLAECLKLQILELRNTPEARAALAICAQPLELIAKRDIRKLVHLCRTDEDTVRGALALIARLEPKPGRRFVDVERNVVVPDVIVTRAGRGFKVILNPDVMPRLRVHDVYANALRQNRGGRDGGEGGHAAMQQRLQEARWFIKNIQQRFDTILRVSSAIVERQRNFFMHGELAMRPLVLREIADELGLHESTISRVTTAKYMATPFGTYELKYFFGSSLGTETGGNASSTAVRALLKQFIAAEAPAKPLSDNQLSDLLKEQGIECARRTVAKYREAMRIAPANLRKSL